MRERHVRFQRAQTEAGIPVQQDLLSFDNGLILIEPFDQAVAQRV